MAVLDRSSGADTEATFARVCLQAPRVVSGVRPY